MKLQLLRAGANLIEAVAARLAAEGKDYSRNWVVFPEQRPGHYLRRVLAGREKSGFIPPRLDSIDTFVDRVYAEHLGRKDRNVEVLDAVAMLFELHRSAPDRLGREHYLSADHFFSLGVKLFNDLEELMAASLTAEELLSREALTEENVPRETRNRLQSLAFFFDRFYALLRDRRASTRSMRLRDTAALLRPELIPGIDRFVFAGFYSLTRAETSLLKSLLAWDSFSLLLNEGEGLDELLRSLGLEAEPLPHGPAESRAETAAPALEFIKCPDAHGEVFALNKALESRLADPRHLNERQVVVLPAAETLFPLYLQTLAGLDETKDFNISLGYPLTRTPVYSFFHNLLELVQSMDEEGRVYAPAYLRFVLHPYTKNLYFPGFDQRADLTRILFHAVEEEFSRHKTRAFWRLDEIESDPGVRRSIQDISRGVEDAPEVPAFVEHLGHIHRRTIVPFRAIADTGDFARKLIAVLDYVYENGTARQHHFFHPYAEAFRSRLDSLARSMLRDVVFEERSSYWHLFQRVMAGGTVPFSGTPVSGLQVLGFWETRGLPFEDVSILDMNEDVIPSFPRVDSLLPLATRRALGLPTHQDHERRMAYHLHNLMAGARRVRFFFIENPDREPSRFIQKLIWERQKRAGGLSGSTAASETEVRTVQYRVALQPARTGPVAKTPAVVAFLKDFTYSATALDQYLACPLQFYYAYVLNLREKEEVGEEVEKKDLGTLVHAILEEYYQPFVGRVLRPADLDAGRMAAIVDAFFERAFGRDITGNAYLMKLQARRHLTDFVEGYQLPLARQYQGRGGGLRVLGLEQRLSQERRVDGRTFRLAAKVDRTETRQGRLHVLDYKTAANEKYYGVNYPKLDLEDRATWNRAVASLQLPLYTMILAQARRMPSADIHCCLVMLGKNRLGPSIEFFPYDQDPPEQRAEQVRVMEALIDRLLVEISSGEVPFDPGLASERACAWCPYTVLCQPL